MARIRAVKPELRRSLTVGEWPIPVRYAWVLLWGYLDDLGRGVDDVRLIVADLFPLDREVTEKKMATWLEMMAKSGVLCRYNADDMRFLHAVKWADHQRINRPSPSRIPPCPTHDLLTEPSVSPHGGLTGSFSEGSEPRARARAQAGDARVRNRDQRIRGSEDQGAGSTTAPRDRDAMWDGLIAACDITDTEITKGQRGSLNAAVRDLRDIGADPDDIPRRAANYMLRFPNAPLTPPALAKHWAQCAAAPATARSQHQAEVDAWEQRAYARAQALERGEQPKELDP